MIKNDKFINSLLYDDVVKVICERDNLSETDARAKLSSMSFSEYCHLIEQPITPPSGQALGPSTPKQTTTTPQIDTMKSDDEKETVVGWSGVGPITPGITVGLQHDTNKVIPGKVEKVDNATKTVTVLNPTTNKTEVYSNTDPRIQKFMAKKEVEQTTEDLKRLKHLAGIVETSSAGAVSAGNIAVAVKELDNNGELIRRRSKTEEKWSKEYKGLPGNKTIVGDTKPNQAIGELSANLVANNKVSAARGKKLK